MGRLCVRLFGRFDATFEDQLTLAARPLRGLEARKLQECFSYLLLHRNRVFPREILAELVGPEMPAEQSRKSLRQILWQLQSALASAASPAPSCEEASGPGHNDSGHNDPGCNGPDHDRPLIVDAEWVQINPSYPLWLDVAELDGVFGRLVGQPGETLSAEAAEQIRGVVGLYRGDLLEGWYCEWCLLERERLQSAHLALLDKLMGYSAAHQEYEAGLVYGQTILGYDRARERTHQQMMQLHWLSGDRTGALRQYQACTAALKEELGVSPSRRTVELYERIASGEVQVPQPGSPLPSRKRPAPGVPATAPAIPPGPAADKPVSERLRASFLGLLRLQRQVTRQVAELSDLIDSAT
jgi:DNA-binding SARP family transcriptional activator